MALQTEWTTNHGIELPSAYVRIDDQSGGKDQVNIRVRIYANQECAEQQKEWLEELIFSFTPNLDDGAENFIKQGYDYLKTCDAFNDTTDV